VTLYGVQDCRDLVQQTGRSGWLVGRLGLKAEDKFRGHYIMAKGASSANGEIAVCTQCHGFLSMVTKDRVKFSFHIQNYVKTWLSNKSVVDFRTDG
jgi:hypothetical protein